MGWSEKDIPSQEGRVALITGSNSGLGLATAKALARSGAKVIMACRNAEKAESAAEDVRTHAHLAPNPAPVEVVSLDLGSLASVAACAQQILGSEERLDLLVNNAGLMATDESKTVDGFETQFGVNHLGHFALDAQLLPLVLATEGSRVATMSSFGHRPGHLDADDPNFERRSYNRWVAYFQSKLSNLLFALEFQRRLSAAGSRTISVAAHPGGTHTDLGFEGQSITNKAMKPLMQLAQSTERGALPILRALTAPDVEGGQFYGPNLMVQGAPRLEKPSRRARNPETARRLWEISEELTKIPFTIPPANG